MKVTSLSFVPSDNDFLFQNPAGGQTLVERVRCVVMGFKIFCLYSLKIWEVSLKNMLHNLKKLAYLLSTMIASNNHDHNIASPEKKNFDSFHSSIGLVSLDI